MHIQYMNISCNCLLVFVHVNGLTTHASQNAYSICMQLEWKSHQIGIKKRSTCSLNSYKKLILHFIIVNQCALIYPGNLVVFSLNGKQIVLKMIAFKLSGYSNLKIKHRLLEYSSANASTLKIRSQNSFPIMSACVRSRFSAIAVNSFFIHPIRFKLQEM